jgi:hypothetical protein
MRQQRRRLYRELVGPLMRPGLGHVWGSIHIPILITILQPRVCTFDGLILPLSSISVIILTRPLVLLLLLSRPLMLLILLRLLLILVRLLLILVRLLLLSLPLRVLPKALDRRLVVRLLLIVRCAAVVRGGLVHRAAVELAPGRVAMHLGDGQTVGLAHATRMKSSAGRAPRRRRGDGRPPGGEGPGAAG